MIKQLEQGGLVRRERRSDDGRVQLAAATETLAELVTLLQQQPIR
jgi:DNA-binding MarR family transcriptional regulator